jgi:hypothetical protein
MIALQLGEMKPWGLYRSFVLMQARLSREKMGGSPSLAASEAASCRPAALSLLLLLLLLLLLFHQVAEEER